MAGATQELSDRLDEATRKLGDLPTAIYNAYDALGKAEEEWDELYDGVAEQLKSEFEEEGRRGDPTGPTILSATRRLHRDAYRRWRSAQREVVRLEQISKALRAEVSGLQTERRETGANGESSGRTSTKGMTQHAKDRAAATPRAA